MIAQGLWNENPLRGHTKKKKKKSKQTRQEVKYMLKKNYRTYNCKDYVFSPLISVIKEQKKTHAFKYAS